MPSIDKRKLPVALFFLGGGIAHLTFGRKFFEDIVPSWLPASKATVNTAAGIAELTGGALVLAPLIKWVTSAVRKPAGA